MKINDSVSGAALAVLGATILVHVQSFPQMPGQKVGPAMFPGLLAIGLLICAATVIYRGIKDLRSEPVVTWPGWVGQRRIALGFFLIPAVLVAYIVASERIGFLPSAVAFLLTLFWVFGVRPWVGLVVAIGGALGIHYVFYKLLKVPLPWGLLSSLAW